MLLCWGTVCQKGVKKKKKLSGFGAYIFDIDIPRLDYDKIKVFGVQNLEKNRFLYFMYQLHILTKWCYFQQLKLNAKV